MDILDEVEKKAKVSLGENVSYTLKDKVRNGKLYVEQGIIAGCAGGGFENICDAADILKGKSIGADEFSLKYLSGKYADLYGIGKERRIGRFDADRCYCKNRISADSCFGAGDTPANNALSIGDSTRNFPNREGSKLQEGQISSVALMDARLIAATGRNKGCLTAATEYEGTYRKPAYFFDGSIYENRVFDCKGVADPDVEVQFGPNIKDWPKMPKLPENLLLQVTAEIDDPVTTTDELIPSGETSSYRSNKSDKTGRIWIIQKSAGLCGIGKEYSKRRNSQRAGRNSGREGVRALSDKRTDTGRVCSDGLGKIQVSEARFLQKSRETAQPESRQHPARRYWEAGEYCQRVRHKKISFQSDSNWACFGFYLQKSSCPLPRGIIFTFQHIQEAVKEGKRRAYSLCCKRRTFTFYFKIR